MKYEIRELSATGVLGQAVDLLKNNIGLIFGIMACLTIPLSLARGIAFHYLMSDVGSLASGFSEAGEVDVEQLMSAFAGMARYMSIVSLFGLLTAVVVMPLTNGAVMHAISRKYLGQSASVGNSMGFALKRLPSLIWTSLLRSIFVVIGLMLLIIPGLVLMFRYMLSDHAVVVEGMSGGAALKRSGTLMKGQLLNVFVLVVLLVVIHIVVTILAGLVPVAQLSILVSSLVEGILMGLVSSAWVVFYYSARSRHEEFTVARLAEDIGDGAPASSGVNEVGSPKGTPS